MAPRPTQTKHSFAQGHIASKERLRYDLIGVPGTVMGLNTLRDRYGTWSLARLLAPSIALAEHGYVLSEAGAKILRHGKNQFSQQKNVAQIFMKKGKLLTAGERVYQPTLARTLRQIAQGGSAAFAWKAIFIE